MPAVLSAPCVAADLSPLRRRDSPARAANILIDMAQNRIIVRIIRSTEGAVMRRHASGIGCGARGRGMNAPPKLPGGAGAPPGETTVPCQELADGGPPGLPEARRARPPKRGLAPQSRRQGETARQKARPGAVTTMRWRAERRHVLVTARDLRPN